ncbi:hypothetical protein MXB_2904, partial [Myxobolus squamalis]
MHHLHQITIYWISFVISLFDDHIICRRGSGKIIKNNLLYLLTKIKTGVTVASFDKTCVGISILKDFLQNFVLLHFITVFI